MQSPLRSKDSRSNSGPLVLILIGVAITVLLFGLVLWDVFSTYGTLTAIERDALALNRLENDLRRLDESLSSTALLAVSSDDSSWQTRYRLLEPELDQAIAHAALVLDTARSGVEISRARSAHRLRVETEREAMSLAASGSRPQAVQLLKSDAYRQRRREYIASLESALNVLDDREELNSRLLRWRFALTGVLAILVLAVAWLRIFQTQRANLRARQQAEVERERLIGELTRQRDELERFSYTVSHDLRSPLISIHGFLRWAEREAREGNLDNMRSHLARIADSATRMEHLIEAILRLSRAEHMEPRRDAVPLNEPVQEAVKLLQGRIQERAARIEICPELPVVLGDRSQLMEVYLNLVDNALKFMGEQTDPCVEIGLRSEPERTVLFVKDNGIGIERHQHDVVFRRFERLGVPGEGSGLGLALVKRIVEKHGGVVWVESQGHNTGAAFCFVLPLAVSGTHDAPA
jgi:signal transduction histidine kinase